MDFSKEGAKDSLKKKADSLKNAASGLKNNLKDASSNLKGLTKKLSSAKPLVIIIISTFLLCSLVVFLSVSSVARRKRRSEILSAQSSQNRGLDVAGTGASDAQTAESAAHTGEPGDVDSGVPGSASGAAAPLRANVFSDSGASAAGFALTGGSSAAPTAQEAGNPHGANADLSSAGTENASAALSYEGNANTLYSGNINGKSVSANTGNGAGVASPVNASAAGNSSGYSGNRSFGVENGAGAPISENMQGAVQDVSLAQVAEGAKIAVPEIGSSLRTVSSGGSAGNAIFSASGNAASSLGSGSGSNATLSAGENVASSSPVSGNAGMDASGQLSSVGADAQEDSRIPLGKIQYSQYVVKEGDSVRSIADEHGLKTGTIIQVNSLKTVYPEAGTVLNIPNLDGQVYHVQAGDSVFSIVQKFSLSISWNTFKTLNGLESDELKEGEALFIPYADATDNDFSSVRGADDSLFSNPLKNAGLFAGFSVNVQDPLSGEVKESDGVLLQTIGTSDVYASSSGSVVDKGFNPNGTYFVKVSHRNGYTSYYNYLTWTKVKVGDRIIKGESLGTISAGNTNFERPTLFFRIEQDGISLDPASFFDLSM